MKGWDLDTVTLERALRAEVMPNPSLDLGNPCNLNCPYCFVEEKLSPRKIRRANELSVDETRCVIEDFHGVGAQSLNIVGAGEPTIDPYFEQIIEVASSLDMVPIVFTNGIRIAREPGLARFLYCNGATVVLKMNSRNQRVQDLVAGRHGYTKLRDQAREILIDSGFTGTSPTRLGIDTIVFRGNLEELPSLYKWCIENNIHPVMGEYIPTGRTDGGRFMGHASLSTVGEASRRTIEDLLQPITATDRFWLAEQIAAINRENNLDNFGPCAYFGGGQCTQVLGLYVDITGDIWPCVARSTENQGVLAPGLLGNVRNGDWPSLIWKAHPYLERRRRLFDGGCPYKAALPRFAAALSGVRPNDLIGPLENGAPS
jgi:MoaA/NifB/PqqE/SkfB family radical SAM enzyme